MSLKKNFAACFLAGIAILIFSVFLSCAKRPVWGDAKTGFILKYRLTKDQVLKYHTSSTQTMTMEMMGQSMVINTDFTLKSTIAFNKINAENNFVTTVTLDTIGTSVKSPQGKQSIDMSGIIGKSFGLIFSSLGKEIEYSGVDSLLVDFGQMAGGKQSPKRYFRDYLPDLPEKPIEIGATWTTEQEQTVPESGMEVTVNSIATNTFTGFETINGAECARITSKLTGTLAGTGERMGNEMNFEGDLEGSNTWYFDYRKGLFIKMVSENFVESTIAVSGQTTMTIPLTQEIKSEMLLIQ